MHGSLHIIYATETDRSRRIGAGDVRTASVRRPRYSIRERVAAHAAASRVPPRAAPGTESPLALAE